MSINALIVIRFLALESNTYVHLNEDEKKLVEQLIEKSIAVLKNSKLFKEYLLGRESYAKEK